VAPVAQINVQPILNVLLMVLDGHDDLKIKAAEAFAAIEVGP